MAKQIQGLRGGRECQGELGAEALAVQHLCLHLEAFVGLLLNLWENNIQLGDLLGRDNGEVLHVLCLVKAKLAPQKTLQQFLHHLHNAYARRDGMPREVCLVDGPFGVNLHTESRMSVRFLL